MASRYFVLLLLTLLVSALGCRSDKLSGDLGSSSGVVSGEEIASISVGTSPVSLPFGGSQSITLTVTNDSATDVSSISISDLDAPFSNPSSGTCFSASILSAGDSCTVEIIFTSPGDNSSTFDDTGTINFVQNGENFSVNFDVSASGSAETTTVSAMYPTNGANWTYWVKNNGSEVYNATDTACAQGTETSRDSCLHGGQMKVATLTGVTDCTGITATDALGVFLWKCYLNGGVATIYSYELESYMGLKDLVDPTAWKNNSISVQLNGSTIFTSASTAWWTNTVAAAPDSSGGVQSLSADTIYTFSSSQNSQGYDINATHVGLVGISNPTITMTTFAHGIRIDNHYAWVEGFTHDGDSVGDENLYVVDGTWNVYRSLTFENSTSAGVRFQSSSTNDFNFVRHIVSRNNGGAGILVNTGSTNISIRDSSFYGNTDRGMGRASGPPNDAYYENLYIYDNSNGGIQGGGNNSVYRNLYLYNNASESLILDPGFDMLVENIFVSNAGTDCTTLGADTDRTTMRNLYYQGCGSFGIDINDAQDLTITNVLIVGSGSYGLYARSGAQNNTISNVTVVNSSSQGVRLTTGPNVVNNVLAMNSSAFSINLEGGDNIYNSFALHSSTGAQTEFGSGGNFHLTFATGGTNETEACNDLGDTHIYDTNCTSTGAEGSSTYTGSSTAIYRPGRDAQSSFVGRVTDSVNGTTGADSNALEMASSITDWTNFENRYRMWSLEGSAGTMQTDQRGPCTGASNCRIWDWRLSSSDTVIRNKSGMYLNGTDQANEPFVGDSVTNCPAAVHGDQTIVDTQTAPNTFLANALEIIDDGVGDDDGLCESSEACIYSPNVGTYQGEGDYLSNGTCNFVDGINPGAVTGVTMYAYPTNGG